MQHIREAIRRGLLSDLTREMLQETEGRVRALRERLAASTTAEVRALRVLPEVIERHLDRLQEALEDDIPQARASLRSILGPIVLRPPPTASSRTSRETHGASWLSTRRPQCG